MHVTVYMYSSNNFLQKYNICHFSEVDLLLVWGGILIDWFTV